MLGRVLRTRLPGIRSSPSISWIRRESSASSGTETATTDTSPPADMTTTGAEMTTAATEGNTLSREICTINDKPEEIRKLVTDRKGNTYIEEIWLRTDNPHVARARLSQLWKEYNSQVKFLRKKYLREYYAKAQAQAQAKAKAKASDAKKSSTPTERDDRDPLRMAKSKKRRQLAAMRKESEAEFQAMLKEKRLEVLRRREENEQLLGQRRAKELEKIEEKSATWINEKDLEDKIMESLSIDNEF